jgi:cellulose synthase/poly-beta-1,6-N-acetylglucosamine synthase-like glycosyltransferase
LGGGLSGSGKNQKGQPSPEGPPEGALALSPSGIVQNCNFSTVCCPKDSKAVEAGTSRLESVRYVEILMRKMKVSVIIPFLNAEKFIREAIESVFAQTYENWELLLIDDGSNDESTVIARSYAAEYPDKVRYLEHRGHQNLGKSTSRNLGIHNAGGDYLAFLDADDIFLPQKLERQVALLESRPWAGMVYGRTLRQLECPRRIVAAYRLGVTDQLFFSPCC